MKEKIKKFFNKMPIWALLTMAFIILTIEVVLFVQCAKNRNLYGEFAVIMLNKGALALNNMINERTKKKEECKNEKDAPKLNRKGNQ